MSDGRVPKRKTNTVWNGPNGGGWSMERTQRAAEGDGGVARIVLRIESASMVRLINSIGRLPTIPGGVRA